MQNILSLKKEFFLLITGLLLVILAMNGNLVQKTISSGNSQIFQKSETPKPTPTPDPKKEYKSLDNFITYQVPPTWQKTDYLDQKHNQTAYITLKSRDYDSPETYIINNGVGIVISRNYDLKAEETLKQQLNAQYESYTYNVLPLKIAGKNAMTMHEDYEGHHRFIKIATPTHLWNIIISSKSLEDEQKYQGEIETFLNSIKFI